MNTREIAKATLFKESFIQVNRALLRILNGDAYAAIILGELVSKYNYYKEKGDLENEWFFLTIFDLESSIGINEYLQRQAIKLLEKQGFIKIKRMGNPSRRHFYIDFEEIFRVVFEGKPIKIHKSMNADKKAFYAELNRASLTTVEEFDHALDNIPRELGEIMFAWSRLYYTRYGKWSWNSTEFGKINNYWKQAYGRRKPYNFRNIYNYFMTYPVEPSIMGFVNYDRSQAEDLGINSLSQMRTWFPEIFGDKENKDG